MFWLRQFVKFTNTLIQYRTTHSKRLSDTERGSFYSLPTSCVPHPPRHLTVDVTHAQRTTRKADNTFAISHLARNLNEQILSILSLYLYFNIFNIFSFILFQDSSTLYTVYNLCTLTY